MKKIKYFLPIVLLSFILGCNDFLEAEPKTRVVPRNFLDTELEVEQAVTAMYRQFRNIYVGEQWKWGEIRSDNTSNDTLSNRERPQLVDEFILSAGSQLIQTYWLGSYQGIYRSNILIDAMTDPDPDLRFESATTQDRVEGEARFFRAFYYHNLVRLFGEVPVIEITVEGISDRPVFANIPRSAVSVVYDQIIISDLESAADLLPQSYDSDNTGRVTRGAALTLLGEVYLSVQDYANAITVLEEVRTLGYMLNANYEENFDPAFKNGPESIFEIQFEVDVQQAAGFFRNWVPANSSGGVISSINAQGEAGKNQPTQDLIDEFETGDLRESVSIAYFERLATGGLPVPYINKYNYEFLNEAGIVGSDVNYPVFRYADALLLLAEAYNEASFGSLPDASILLLNRVRNRAGLDPLVRGLDFSTAEDLRLLILKERRIELAFENKRWFDLLRIEARDPGFLTDLMTAHGLEEIAVKENYLEPSAYANIRLLLGLPAEQVTTYGYVQNDGWE